MAAVGIILQSELGPLITVYVCLATDNCQIILAAIPFNYLVAAGVKVCSLQMCPHTEAEHSLLCSPVICLSDVI